MAKQTFTTGQVLTAAQMTSLQQTAMLGGAASAKTASYTLVAADAGTAISMSNASATTITVNTGLFAAGDTVQITNLGAGVCTITAGTATVNTSASLALAQYESGTLNFTSTSAAIFIKGAGAAASSGSNWTLLNAGGTALTGAQTVTVSGISAKNKIAVIIDSASSASASSELKIRFNTDTGSNYTTFGNIGVLSGTYAAGNFGGYKTSTNGFLIATQNDVAAGIMHAALFMDGCNASGLKMVHGNGGGTDAGAGFSMRMYNFGGIYNSASVITSVSAFSGTGNWDAGTIFVYTTT